MRSFSGVKNPVRAISLFLVSILSIAPCAMSTQQPTPKVVIETIFGDIAFVARHALFLQGQGGSGQTFPLALFTFSILL